jgi:cation:H+ antiporter
MSIFIALGLLVLGIVLLLYGADWFMDGIKDLAQTIGMSPLVLGVILAGLEPEEMLTATLASGRGDGYLALSDVVGTNITIATLALGLSALLLPIALHRGLRRQALIATLASVPPIILLLLGPITRLAGLLMLLIFVIYTVVLIRTDRKALARIAEDDDDDDEPAHKPTTWKLLAITAAGLLAMALGGPAIVGGAEQLARNAGLTQYAVGATIVALGTGAEMVALGITAARKHLVDILVGGILGSFAYNLLVTLGLAAVAQPLPAIPPAVQSTAWLMISVHLVLLLLIWRGKIGRVVGALLILVYLAYIAGTIALQIHG